MRGEKKDSVREILKCRGTKLHREIYIENGNILAVGYL
jgi:hypothetical protein